MSDNELNITVDGQKLTARRGQMLIEVTDAAGIDIPRFCYHKKLSVAANCRMCLVEVEKAPKPLPACATPVMPDMVVKTRSKTALAAQKGTMEFLLINHPLDCPICDQGGECELQDVAMGYGGGVSQYTEGKRVVLDKYIGPLIATEMTRCIHCTRCVRFGEEIAGVRELGATGRGENTRIGTYIEKSVASEVSGNVIDVCPVGALTARPSRFSARAWELSQAPSVAQHDCIGSNIFVHTDNGRINRVVPRDNEAVNEVWISDRDRFSYQGLLHDRVLQPLVRTENGLVETTWEKALNHAAVALEAAAKAGKLGVLGGRSESIEALYLLQKLARGLGCNNIDYRVSQADFAGDALAPIMPWLGMSVDGLEKLQSALVVGANLRKDQPIAALRLRKSALKGAAISFVNPRAFPLHFDAAENRVCRSDQMVAELAAIASALGADTSALSNLPSVEVQAAHQTIADSLKSADNAAVLLGNIAQDHPQATELLLLARAISKASGATLGLLSLGANSAGASLAGCLPHRDVAGASVDKPGLNAGQMLAEPLDAYLLLGVEPAFDANNSAEALATLGKAKDVIAISSHHSDAQNEYASVVLPAAIGPEAYATLVNAAGLWQSAKGIITPPEAARPAWKILRVLADLLSVEGCAYNDPAAITRDLMQQCREVSLDNHQAPGQSGTTTFACRDAGSAEFVRAGDIPIYATDTTVRRATALQKTEDALAQQQAWLCQADADQLGIADGADISVDQAGASAKLVARIDNGVPKGSVWVSGGTTASRGLGALNGAAEVSKA